MASRVSERGQITIDHACRRLLGVQPGMLAYQRIVDGHLEVIFLPPPHRRSLFGALHRDGEPPLVTTAEQLEQAVMEAVAEKQARLIRPDD